MAQASHANLAGWPIIFLLLALGPLKEPLKVRFQLTDGVRVSGEMTTWDKDGFDGSFGRRLWTQIKADDVWTLHQRVMDQRSIDQWVNLGRVLLLMVHTEKKADELAENAFRRAMKLDASAATAIQQARDEAALAERKRRDSEKAASAAKLTTISPEGDPWPADPWPVLSEAEQKNAVLSMRADAERILEQAGMGLVPVETEHFLLYTDLPRTDAAKWIMQLEKTFEALQRLFQIPDSNGQKGDFRSFRGCWGKVVVLVFGEQDRFRLVEAESFKHLVPQAAVGVCHPQGPKTFINMHHQVDDAMFEWSLIRETVHAYMHRYRTPRRLPAWANEGLGEFVAALMVDDPALVKQRRKNGLEFIRGGGNINAVLDLTYAEQTWPGPQGIGFPVGALLTELMLQEKPKRYIEWVNAVKDGKDWQEALQKEFGTPRAALVETFIQYFKVND